MAMFPKPSESEYDDIYFSDDSHYYYLPQAKVFMIVGKTGVIAKFKVKRTDEKPN